MTEIEELRKRLESEEALNESLHRYTEALEGKCKMLEEKRKYAENMVTELTQKLKELLQ